MTCVPVTDSRAGAGGTGGTAGAALRTEESAAGESWWISVSELPGGSAFTSGRMRPRKNGTTSTHSEVMNGIRPERRPSTTR